PPPGAGDGGIYVGPRPELTFLEQVGSAPIPSPVADTPPAFSEQGLWAAILAQTGQSDRADQGMPFQRLPQPAPAVSPAGLPLQQPGPTPPGPAPAQPAPAGDLPLATRPVAQPSPAQVIQREPAPPAISSIQGPTAAAPPATV